MAAARNVGEHTYRPYIIWFEKSCHLLKAG